MLRILLIFYLPLLSVFLFSGRQKLINDSVLELPNWYSICRNSGMISRIPTF